MYITGTDQTPIMDEITVFYITASAPEQREEMAYIFRTRTNWRTEKVLAYPPYTLWQHWRNQNRQTAGYCAWVHTKESDGRIPLLNAIYNWITGSTFNYDWSELLVPTLRFDSTVQKSVTTSLQTCIMYHWNCTTLPRQLGEIRLYDKMRRKYYWPHRASRIYPNVKDFRSCVQNKLFDKQGLREKLFPALRPLWYILWWTFWNHFQKRQGNQLVCNDRWLEETMKSCTED